jgi:hypothetical protein
LDIITPSAAVTILNSVSNIIYEYVGFYLTASTVALTIAGSNILFKNCVFNIKGASSGTILITTGTNITFDGCIFRNPISTQTVNFYTNAITLSSITSGTILFSITSSAASTFSLINCHFYTNYNSTLALYSSQNNYFNSIVRFNPINPTGAINLVMCNNTFNSSCIGANPFNSDTSTDSYLEILGIWTSTSPAFNIYYQLNSHTPGNNIYLYDNAEKDAPDITIIPNSTTLPLATNFKIYFIDLEENTGSNYLKFAFNVTTKKLGAYQSTAPFIYYNLQ